MNRPPMITAALAIALSAACAFAQDAAKPDGPPAADQLQAPNGPGGPPGPGRGDRQGPDGPGGGGGGGVRGERQGPGRGMGMGPMSRDGMDGPPGMRNMGPMNQVELLRAYIDTVDRFTRLTRDPSSAAIAAVVQANDMLKSRGPDAITTYFTKLLPTVKNEAMQRAIRIQLMQAYQASGQQDKALEQAEALITAAPAGAAPVPEKPQ